MKSGFAYRSIPDRPVGDSQIRSPGPYLGIGHLDIFKTIHNFEKRLGHIKDNNKPLTKSEKNENRKNRDRPLGDSHDDICSVFLACKTRYDPTTLDKICFSQTGLD